MEYTRAVHSFLTAGSSRGACVDFLSRRLVGIGHSMGGCCLYVDILTGVTGISG